MSNTGVATGGTVVLKIAGNTIGRAQNVDGDRSFGQEGIYEIGSIMPQGFEPTRFQGSANLARYLVVGNSLADLGIAHLGESILTSGAVDIEVLDKQTGKVIRVYEGCVLNSHSENFAAGALSGERASFLYLRAR
jgi:hypothetical protein